jgi:predicted deacetylase
MEYYGLGYPISIRHHWAYGKCKANAICMTGVFRRVRKILKTTITCVVSVFRPPAWNISSLTERTLMNFDIKVFFEKSVAKIQVSLKLTRIRGTLHEDQYTFLIIFRSVFLRMKNFWQVVVVKIKTHILRSKTFFFENRAVYEKKKKNIWSRTNHRWQYGAGALPAA